MTEYAFKGHEGVLALCRLEEGMEEEITELDWIMEGTPDAVTSITLKGPAHLLTKAKNLILGKAT